MRSLLPGEFDIITAEQAGVNLPEETGATFEENALLKARSAAYQSGRVSVADDSGISVDALEGQPGVRSARFAADYGRAASDEENNRLLLELLTNVPEKQRRARFVSAVAIVNPDGRERVLHGTVDGWIGQEPVGQNGFGYDPLFFPEGFSQTMAQLSEGQKNSISHRGQAFREAVPVIIELSH